MANTVIVRPTSNLVIVRSPGPQGPAGTGGGGGATQFTVLYLKNQDTNNYILLSITGDDSNPTMNWTATGSSVSGGSNYFDSLVVRNLDSLNYLELTLSGADSNPVMTWNPI